MMQDNLKDISLEGPEALNVVTNYYDTDHVQVSASHEWRRMPSWQLFLADDIVR